MITKVSKLVWQPYPPPATKLELPSQCFLWASKPCHRILEGEHLLLSYHQLSPYSFASLLSMLSHWCLAFLCSMGYVLRVLKSPVCSSTLFITLLLYLFTLSSLLFSWWSCFPSCAAWSFYFVPSCSCHKIWWALSISLSPRRPSNSLWLIVLVFDKSCWPSSNKASWRILHLCFSGCFELLSNLSPSSQKPRACNEEQKSMTPWDTHL